GVSGDQAKMWDGLTGKELSSHDTKLVGRPLQLSPDGAKMACEKEDSITIIEPETGHRLARLDRSPLPAEQRRQGPHHVSSAEFSQDSTRFAVGDIDGRLRVWDASTSEILFSKRLDDVVWNVALSPRGDRLAAWAQQNMLRVWDVGAGEEVISVETAGLYNCALAFSNDGKRLAAANKVWDCETGHECFRFGGPSTDVGEIAFNSNESRVATLAKRVTVWDGTTGQELLRLDLT